ncbi:EAL domain-containing protein [Paenibacillus sp. sgz500958]|uniref:bifunctional diguanylate cyclase/phosphodiesterase n=1 Tax=Paenibacillus sp. sgz500958 TaxID=3242475 RepID=UPI0036D3C1C1
MNLRKQIGIFIAGIALLGMGVTYVFIHLILLNRFDKLDEADLRHSMQHIVASYYDELLTMKTSLLNYSMWDETSQFVSSASPEQDNSQNPYVLSNYDNATYNSNRFHIILLLNNRGEAVYGGSYTSEGETAALPQEFIKLLSKASKQSALKGPSDSRSGIVLLDKKPMLITFLPVVESDTDETIEGTAIAGRWLDEEEIAIIGRQSPLGIHITPIGPDEIEQSKGRLTWTRSRSGNLLSMNTVINDIFGNPAIILSMDQPRAIYQSGLHSVRNFRLIYFAITLFTSFVIVLYVNRSILKRMASLIRNIRAISSSHDLSIRIHSTGKDEFSDVEQEFNNMISSLQSAQDKLRLQATLDPLTQLPNRTYFFVKLNEVIEQAKVNHTLVGLLFIDIDHFKTVNDRWGHDYGDALLKEIAGRITGAVGNDGLVSRLGGDEFIILLTDIGENNPLSEHISRLLEALSAPHLIHGHTVISTVSIGASVYPENGMNAELLVKHADLAMFHVKQSGRNNFFQYSDALQGSIRRKKLLGQQLLSAVANGELEVHYQPILSTTTMEITKLEALLRWNNPTYGAVSPAEFIPLAESNGSIVKIGRWVFKQVCSDLCSFHEQGFLLKAAVNISAVQLMQPELQDELLHALKESGLSPSCFELEITESVLMSGDSFFTTLQLLRGHGFRISLDDFGTGFSSLSYLRRFPVDVIKIDRSFITEITPEQTDDTLVKAIIELSHNLGLSVVSEGVELVTQFDMLRNLGSDELQGYYISRPLRTSGIISFLSQDTPNYDK